MELALIGLGFFIFGVVPFVIYCYNTGKNAKEEAVKREQKQREQARRSKSNANLRY